jgi:hypothetical protein
VRTVFACHVEDRIKAELTFSICKLRDRKRRRRDRLGGSFAQAPIRRPPK